MSAENEENPNVTGLTQQEALGRLERFGFNELQADKSRNILDVTLGALREPMVLLLIGIGLIYIILGESEEVYSLFTFLILILGITIYQENRTEKTLSALRELSSPRAIVIREGKQLRIPGREVVPDDIVLLNEGDRVPADIELISGEPLSIDESIITGESFPVDKSPLMKDTALSGTLVLKGQALGRIIKTGEQTELGKIGKSLGEKKETATPLLKQTRKIVKSLSLKVGLLTLFIVVYYWLTREELLDGILIGLTLAMAILPNELPAVLLIFLAAGAWRISKRNVLTRQVPAIEALGAITYLCVDKTGTLTQNKMILKVLWNGHESLEVTGLGQDFPEAFHELMEYGILATPRSPFDPMEIAIQQSGTSLLENTEHLHPGWRLSREYQITDALLAVSYAWKSEEETNRFTIGAKGATEAVIDLCHLPNEEAKLIEEEMITMAARGLRVIGVAQAFSTFLPENQHDLNFKFIGLLGFEDPVRDDAKSSVKECQDAGIKVIMMTGDHPVTAKSIAHQIGFSESELTITGSDVHGLDDKHLLEKLDHVRIFCRMQPLDKLRIVSLLQSKGEVVAMTGDGVNDAPALRKAQIGIAMGKRGTDVAREASSIVLLDDSFSSIVAAIRTGRRIYINLQKALSYLLSVHIPITALSIIPVIFNLPLILLPVHIAFLHLIIEPVSTTLFEALPEAPGPMKEKPRSQEFWLLPRSEMKRSLKSGLVISIMVIGVYVLALQRGLTAADARGITFTTLIMTNLFLIYLMKRERRDRIKTPHFKVLAIASLALLGIVLYLPFFRELFRFEVMHFHDLILCLGVTVVTALIVSPLYPEQSTGE